MGTLHRNRLSIFTKKGRFLKNFLKKPHISKGMSALFLSPKYRVCTFLFVMSVALLIPVHGCVGETDTVVVDFSETVDVERHEERSDQPSLRVAVGAMISPKETFFYYHQLLDYIGQKLDRKIHLIQRKTYGEINELFGRGRIDLAFICSGPYAIGREKYGFELLATPQVQGSHSYHSYLIVNKESTFYGLEDLRNRVFAFTDPDSNTGRIVPAFWLAEMGERPETFFNKTIYTYSHDNSILAVGRDLVDGAAVDSLIWDYYQSKNPSYTTRTRIIKKSEPYGIPPLVVSQHQPPELKKSLHQLVLTMHMDSEGGRILKELMIERFVAPEEEWYMSIRKISQRLVLDTKKVHGF